MNNQELHKLIESKISGNYSLIQGFFKKSDWTNGLQLGADLIVVYDMNIIANIDSVNSLLLENLFLIKSQKEVVNYSELCKVETLGGLVQLSSDIVSFHDTKLFFEELTPGILTKIYSGYFKYYIIKTGENVK